MIMKMAIMSKVKKETKMVRSAKKMRKSVMSEGREHKIISNAIIAMSIAISMRKYDKAESGAREILASVQRLIRSKK